MFSAHDLRHGVPYERRPQQRLFRLLESLRHDAHHGAALTVQPQLLADDVWICAKVALPQLVREHDAVGAIAFVIARHDGPPEERRHAPDAAAWRFDARR